MDTQVNIGKDEIKIRFKNNTEVVIAKDNKNILGICKVKIDGIDMRSCKTSIHPAIDTLDGIFYDIFRYEGVEKIEDRVIVKTTAVGKVGINQEMTDGYYPMITTKLEGEKIEDDLYWIFYPYNVEIRGFKYNGFSYQYRFVSNERKIHKILDKATWEIDGRASGNTVIYQSGFGKPEHTASINSEYTTLEQYYTSKMKTKFIFMQMRPRFGVLQCFDYQHNESGSLFMYFEKPAMIKSLIEKEKGRDVYKYFDQYWFSQSKDITTPGKYVLFRKADVKEKLIDARNHWFKCFDFAGNHYRKYYGLKEDVPVPNSQIDIWCRDMKKAREYLNYCINRIIPQMAQKGIKAFFMGTPWVTSMTENTDDGINLFGSYNPCCPYDFTFAKKMGGDKFFRKMGEVSDKLGIRFMVWISAHLAEEAPESPLFKKNPDWKVRHINTLYYTLNQRIVCAANLNKGFGDHLLKRLKEHIKRNKIRGYFFDSYPNIGMIPIDYSDSELKPQMDKLLEIQRECQKLGAPWYTEGCSPFGISSNGLYYLPDSANNQAVYHGNVSWFFGKEYALYKTSFRISYEAFKTKVLDFNRYFKFMAHKGVLGIGGPWLLQDGRAIKNALDYINDDMVKLNNVYNNYHKYMEDITILEDERGVCWRNSKNNNLLIFAFKDFKINQEYKNIYNVTDDKKLETDLLKAWKVYRIELI